MTCNTCKFCDKVTSRSRYSDGIEFLFCLRYPPAFVEVQSGCNKNMTRVRFPRVSENMWCGEYVEKTETQTTDPRNT